jgi:hypothetical protein
LALFVEGHTTGPAAYREPALKPTAAVLAAPIGGGCANSSAACRRRVNSEYLASDPDGGLAGDLAARYSH